MEAQKEVVRANKLESCYIRPIVFFGSEAMGIAATTLSVHVAIAAWPWGAYLGEEGMAKGIRVKTSSFTRHHVNINMCRAKSVGSYTNSILAHQEVAHDGYDEALLLDPEGYVAEGAGENLFIVKKGKLYTPDLTSCLEGITRDSIITLAKDLGLELIEKRITRDEVYCAEEAFFTGTAAEVTPIRELDTRTIGSGSRGPITAKLQIGILRHRRRQERQVRQLAGTRITDSTRGDEHVQRKQHTTLYRDQRRGAAAVLPDSGSQPVERSSARSHPGGETGRSTLPLLRHVIQVQGRIA